MPLAPPIDAIQQPAVGIYGLPVGASAGAMVLLTAAQIRAHADLSGYVPYTGATGAVNLGSYGLTCGAITASGNAVIGTKVRTTGTGAVLWVSSASAPAVTDDYAQLNDQFLAMNTVSSAAAIVQALHNGSAAHSRLSAFGPSSESGVSIEDVGSTSPARYGYTGAQAVIAFVGGTPRNRIVSASTNGLQIGSTSADWLSFTSAGAVSCAAITASGTIITRNGTSPTSIQVTNTYTSATSFGLLDIRANAAQTAYEISSFLGSAGGANLPINIGHRDSAGTFTSALSVATSGVVTVTRIIGNTASPAAFTFSTGTVTVGSSLGFSANAGGTTNVFAYAGASGVLQLTGPGSVAVTRLCLGSLVSATAPALKPFSGGVAVRLSDDSADAAITCGAITASGAIVPATLTDAAAPNGSIYYSSTAGKLVYKDSGGTVNNLY